MQEDVSEEVQRGKFGSPLLQISGGGKYSSKEEVFILGT